MSALEEARELARSAVKRAVVAGWNTAWVQEMLRAHSWLADEELLAYVRQAEAEVEERRVRRLREGNR